MTFPWKKMKKNTRISELLSNQIHQRRKSGGSPLVVETGFPTVLVDLFVKNKERLKRRGKKNKDPRVPPPPPHPPSAAVASSSSFSSLDNGEIGSSSGAMTLSSSRTSPSASPLRQHHHHIHHRRGGARDINNGNGGGERVSDREGKGEEGVDAHRVLVAILRMFLVVVLLLGTKKFVVGITMSAFVQVFLEYVGKHLYGVLMPCTGVKEKLSLMRCRKGNASSLLCPCGVNNQDQDQGMSNLDREIECCLGPHDEETECEKAGGDDSFSINSVECKEGTDLDKASLQEERNRFENSELSTKKSRRARMKLKMKELVPKRFRTKGRKGRGLEKEASHVVAHNVGVREEEVEFPKGDSRELKFVSDSSSLSREIAAHDKNALDTSCGCDQSAEINMVDTISPKDEETETEQDFGYAIPKETKLERNSGYVVPEETKTEQNYGYVALLLTVLVGLVGGRILALVLTLICCLMQKSGNRRNLKKYI